MPPSRVLALIVVPPDAHPLSPQTATQNRARGDGDRGVRPAAQKGEAAAVVRWPMAGSSAGPP